jgi:hypothetical protein
MEHIDFWQVHGIGFIICMFFFPRLTMLFATTVGGGPLYWIGWLFAPRLTVAIIATTCFWTTNPFLCVLTWIWALGGEGCEKSACASATSGRR